MPSISGPNRPLFGRFKFRVSDPSNTFTSAAFQSCNGLKFTIEKMEYREGGALVSYKEPGLVSFDDLVLERGVSYDLDFYNWIVEVVDIQSHYPGGGGKVSPGFKRELVVEQLERDNTIAIEYAVSKAFPTEYSASEFDNTSSEVSMNSLTLAYHHFERNNVAG